MKFSSIHAFWDIDILATWYLFIINLDKYSRYHSHHSHPNENNFGTGWLESMTSLTRKEREQDL